MYQYRCFGCCTPIPANAHTYCFACRQERAIKQQTDALSQQKVDSRLVQDLLFAVNQLNSSQQYQNQNVVQNTPTDPYWYDKLSDKEKKEWDEGRERRKEFVRKQLQIKRRDHCIGSLFISLPIFGLSWYLFGFHWWVLPICLVVGFFAMFQFHEEAEIFF